VCGDINIAPADLDVFDPDAYVGQTHVTPSERAALAAAGRDVADVVAVTTHNPFAVNDLYLARETGIAPERMNAHGCSLVFGHPQGPTGLRSIAELIEALR